MRRNSVSEFIPNPSNEVRHNILKNTLKFLGREEDLENIIDLLAPPPDISTYASPGKFKDIKIGVIGGGLAGMAAAYELRKLGCQITVFEAQKRIGGRIYTHYFDKNKNIYGELGALRIPVSHEATWHYINAFNINTTQFIQTNPNTFIYSNNIRIRNNENEIQNKLYPSYELNEDEKNVPYNKLSSYALNYYLNKLTPNVRTEILKILPSYSQEYKQLIGMSIRRNFENIGYSQGATAMITSTNSALSELIEGSFSEILSSGYGADFAGYYQIDGGFSNLPMAFYNSLKSDNPSELKEEFRKNLGKVTWNSGNWVTGIYQEDNSKKVTLKYGSKKDSKIKSEEFDYVICAIPFTTLATVEIKPQFSNKKMQAIKEIGYVDSTKSLFLCNRRFWEEDMDYGRIKGGISSTDLIIKRILYPSNDLDSKDSRNKQGVLVGAYNFDKSATKLGNINQDLFDDLVKRQVEEVHGLKANFLDSVVTKTLRINWNKEEWFRGAFSFFTPDQKRLFSDAIVKSEYNSRVFFAGEHTSVNHGWIQGALHSGKKAANDLIISNSKQ